MKAQIKIPVGYRRLRKSEATGKGDLFLDDMIWEWCKTTCPGRKAGQIGMAEIYIRKIKNPKRKP